MTTPKTKLFSLLTLLAMVFSFAPRTIQALTYNEIVAVQTGKVLGDSTTNNPLIGYMDGFQQSLGIVSGWAAATDVPNQSLVVNFYVDGTQSTGTLAGTVTANDPSDDVNKVLLITGQHRFHWTIPSTYHGGKNHSLYIYGV